MRHFFAAGVGSGTRFFPLFGFGEPAAAQIFRCDGREIGLDIEDGRAVEHVDATDVEHCALDAKQLDDGEADGIGAARRPSGEDAMRTVVGRRSTDELVILVLAEDPEDKEVREAFDVLEAGLKIGAEFEDALFGVLCTKAARDGVGVLKRAAHPADGTHGVGVRDGSAHGSMLRAVRGRRSESQSAGRFSSWKTVAPGDYFKFGTDGIFNRDDRTCFEHKCGKHGTELVNGERIVAFDEHVASPLADPDDKELDFEVRRRLPIAKDLKDAFLGVFVLDRRALWALEPADYIFHWISLPENREFDSRGGVYTLDEGE